MVTQAVAKLNPDWPQAVRKLDAGSRLDDRFLSTLTLIFAVFPDLHNELCKSWNKPFSARLSTPQLLEYSNVAEVKDHGYGTMPR